MQHAAQDSLDSSMQLSPISVDTKCEILKNLWNLALTPHQFYDNDFDYEIYFAYYTDQCSLALHDGGRHILLRTHRDVIDIASYIKSSLSRESIVQLLHSKFPTTSSSNKVVLVIWSVSLEYKSSGRQTLQIIYD
jgi:hypothetical protein